MIMMQCKVLRAGSFTVAPRRIVRRAFLSSDHKGFKPIQVTGPTRKESAWESGARLVKNTKIENQYTETIRAEVDPAAQLRQVEDELKGMIGQALGRQGEKILTFMRAMEQERQRYQQLLEQHGPSDKVVLESAVKHNGYRKECVQARWELIVHRQAVGFIVGNHNYVMETFPIGDALPTEPKNGNSEEEEKEAIRRKEEQRKKFSDQLDWWQRVGRWR